MVKLLLGKKANIEARNHDGFSALYFAVKNNQTSVVDLLIEKGISLYDIIFGEPQFYCLDSGTAKRTHAINVCNGSPDCQDKTDEHPDICSKNDFLKTHDKPVYLKKTSVHNIIFNFQGHFICNDWQFPCTSPSPKCISGKHVCDKKADCDDGSDEDLCFPSDTISAVRAKDGHCPTAYHYICPDGTYCADGNKFCHGKSVCPDASEMSSYCSESKKSINCSTFTDKDYEPCPQDDTSLYQNIQCFSRPVAYGCSTDDCYRTCHLYTSTSKRHKRG